MPQIKPRVLITTLLIGLFFAINSVNPVFATGTKTVTTPPSATKADLVANDSGVTANIECSGLKTHLEGYGTLYPFTSWPYGTLNQFKVDGAPPTSWTDYTNISNAPVSSPKISIKRTSNSIEWTSNFGIDFVMVKGGTGGSNIYIYAPSGTSGGSLTTPNGQGISHVTFCWDNPAKIKVDKSTSPNTLDNVDFNFTLKIPNYIKNQASTISENFQLSDSDGVLTFADLPKGNYDLNEILTSSEDSVWSTSVVCTRKRSGSTSTIINSNEDETIDLDGVTNGDEISCVFTNSKPTRSIKFVKKEAGTYTYLNGWKIQVKQNGTVIAEGTTGEDGTGVVIIDNLPFGTYQYCEVLQSGWVAQNPSNGCHTDTIDSNTGTGTSNVATENVGTQTGGGTGIDTFYFFNQKQTRSIKFVKKEYGSNILLNGWKIQVKKDGVVIAEGTTGDDGTGVVIIDNLPFGTYQYCEVLQSGWTAHSPDTGCFTDTIDSNTPTGTSATATETLNTQTGGGSGIETYTFINKKQTGSLKVTKSVNWNSVTQDTGKTFQICISGPSFPSPAKDCKTFDYDGGDQTWTNLLPGDYTVTETDPGTNWTVSGSGVTATVVANQTATKTVTNTHKKGSLKVTKSVNWNGITPDTGKTFQICISGPSFPSPAKDCKTFDYDGGDQTWTNLIPGDYTVTETNPGSSWTVSGSGVTATVVADQTATKTVTNTHKKGSLKVTKSVNWNGITPDTGKTFQICISGPSFPSPAKDCKTFDYDGGDQTWTNLIPGDYTVTETDPGTNWTVSGSGVTATVVADQTAHKTVTNTHKKGSLKVTKSVNWNSVTQDTGKTFQICISGPSFPSPAKDCKTFDYDGGDQTWTNLIPGDYTVTETDPGTNWTVSGSGVTATVVADQTVSKTVTNTHKKGSLKVIKSVNWNSITPDTGKTFQICISGPSFPSPAKDCKTFDYDGEFKIWDNLIPGDYTVTETNPGANWTVTGSGVTATVVADQTVSKTVTNKHHNGSLKVTKVVQWSGVTPDTGKTFQICISGPSFPSPAKDCKTFDYDGEFKTWTNLIPGVYTVTETDPGSNEWKAPVYSGSSTVVDGQTAHTTVTNERKTPGVDIKKYTNGKDADTANGDVPKVAPGATVTWTYIISNTGAVSFPKASVVVTDNLKDIPTANSIVPVFVSELSGNGDNNFDPGERWLYRATGTALNLVAQGTKTWIVPGCATSQSINRPVYENYGHISITGTQLKDYDPSHYCNPEVPGIDIKKYTNGKDADSANGDVPQVSPNGDIVWTYVVSNTGNVPFLKASVVVTDNLKDIPVANSVVPVYDSEQFGDGDQTFEPGERWVYRATGKALNLVAQGTKTYIVNGCQTGQGINRPVYENYGHVRITGTQLKDNDPSHYCNPEVPGIDIKKYTNGKDADSANGDVPQVSPNGDIVWTYVVSNTGNVPFLKASVVVTDNLKDIPVANSVVPVFDSEQFGNGNEILDPGERWVFKATGKALNLVTLGGPAYVVNGCQTGQGINRPVYENYGHVGITGTQLKDNDPSHYCNPEVPGIEIKKYTNGKDADSAFGDVPQVAPNGAIVWTYIVSNTGNVPFLKASVVVTDNLKDIPVANSVVPVFIGEQSGNGDETFNPGERWIYQATGTALNLVAQGTKTYIVNGCQTGEGINRPVYENYGHVGITGTQLKDNDPSHYCNPEVPGIEIKKYTNGADADSATGSDVPKVSPNGEIVWTYIVSNTGNVPFLKASIVVTDNLKDIPVANSIVPVFDSEQFGNGNEILDPGERWVYKATGTAMDLVAAGEKSYIVNGCQTGLGVDRPVYENYGHVGITGTQLKDNDPSHYCNPEEPGLEIKKYTNGYDADDPNGSDVPKIAPDGTIEWTYVISNTGNVPYAFDDVKVTDDQGVMPIFVGYLFGDTDDTFEPGERWLYKANGNAVLLELDPENDIIEGCLVEETLKRPTYNNTGMVSVENGPSDTDESHYCNPFTPGISIKKYTNGEDADTPTGPVVAVGSTVTWTYIVTNTGNVPLANVVVTDNIAGVTPVYISGDTNTDGKLDLTEEWLFRTTGIAVAGQYKNIGYTKGTPPEGDDVKDDDPSHYFAGNPTVAALGDLVWHDRNMNGLQDEGEPGVPGVEVNLLAGDCTTPMGQTTTTNENGIYGFGNLTPGDYCVEFDLTTLPTGYLVTTQNANSNGNDTTDSDGDPITGKTQSVNLPGGTTNLTLDLGIYKLASLGDRVWYDNNENGLQDEGEPGVPNVTVNLLAGDCSTSMGKSTTTNGEGLYSFIDLTPGSYCVEFVKGSLPDDYALTTKDAGDDTKDSDADSGTGKTSPVTLQSGDNNTTLDAGIVALGLQVVATPQCIKDGPYVQYAVTGKNFTPPSNSLTIRWIDVNTNAVLYEYTNQPLAATVLWPEAGVDGNGVGNKWPGWSLVDGTWVDNGSSLRPQVRIEFSINPDESVTVAYPPANPTCSAAPRASLGNRVWEDSNKNGLQDNGEPNVSGVTVTLYTCEDVKVGQPLVTDENGNYLFTGLMPGSYYVIFNPATLPDGFTFTTPNNGNDDVDSDADTTTGKTACVTLEDGDNYVDLDAGVVAPTQPGLAALGDTVWYDLDKDGIQDGGEAGVPGVKVDLYKSDGTFVATQNTNLNGKYLFTDLEPGSYYVEFATVQGYVYTRYNVNANGQDALDSDPPMPWIDITIDDGGEPAVKGEALTYTFFFTNTDATLAAQNVVISTTVPAGTTYNDALSDTRWECPGEAAGTVCTLTLATLNGGTSGSAAFTIIVDENAPNVPLDIFTSVTQSTLARTQVVTLVAGQTNLTLDAGIVILDGMLTTPTPTDPTNIPGGEQPNQRKAIFLPMVQGNGAVGR